MWDTVLPSHMRADSTGETSSPTETVLHEVAEQKGVPPEELNPFLYDVIDPDALDTIFRGDTGHVSFEYHGYIVTVSHTGNVELEPTNSD